jgi:flagellar hook-length control protein FliK
MADIPANDQLGDTAQALPLRPGAAAVQPRRFKGTVTEGRPLPPRAGEVPAAAAPRLAAAAPAVTAAATATPVSAAIAAPVAAPVAVPAALAARPSKPDARPMRFVFGAGAVAAVSVLTIGLVKPDWSNASEPSATDQDAVSAAIDATDSSAPRTRVKGRARHVTEYVFLAPGEKAPNGATVISNDKYLTRMGIAPDEPSAPASDPTARPGVAAKPDRQPTTQTNNKPTTQANKPAADKPVTPDKPAADKPAAPAPTKPPVTTRQSGS